MKSKTLTIVVGILMSMSMLFVGFFALDRVAKKEETVKVQGTVVKEDKEVPVVEEPEKVVQLERLPNAENEAAKWNATATDFIETYPMFRLDASRIIKDESLSNDEFTTFFHEFQASLRIRLQYTIDNETKEITEMKLIGYEIAGADRSAIFHSMSMFVSYVDSEVSVSQANEYLGEIPFATDKDGLYKVEFNGKKYEFTLDLTDGLNMLVFRVGE
ncbi:hypothetical protein [Paenisporosarcina sp. NPDC076898]|uniref:hypothetical protein n=1 Tax=unclassified Paenisporosarcina TaxID=2642018 RepID=UPI003CFFDD5E